MAKQLNVDVNLNTAKAEAALRKLQQELTTAITSATSGSNGSLTKEIVAATKEASNLKVMLSQAVNPQTGNLDLSKFSQQLAKSKTSLNDYAKSLTNLGPTGQKAFMSLTKSIVSAEVPMRQSSKLITELGTTLKNTARWQLTSSLLHNFIGGIQSAFSYARGLNDQDRARIIIFVSRLINLEDSELRNQFFEELKKLEGKSNMAELTWIEERFRDEAVSKGVAEGIVIGETRGRLAANLETARRLRNMGMNDHDIQKATNLSFDEMKIL